MLPRGGILIKEKVDTGQQRYKETLPQRKQNTKGSHNNEPSKCSYLYFHLRYLKITYYPFPLREKPLDRNIVLLTHKANTENHIPNPHIYYTPRNETWK